MSSDETKSHKLNAPRVLPVSTEHGKGNLKFPLAVLKGVIEKDDGAAYFGSLIGYPVWVEETKALGLIAKSSSGLGATRLGQMIYNEGVDLLPKRGRAVGWTWPPELFEKAEKAIAQAEQGLPAARAEKEERP